jgi:hypothetical protein
MSMCVLNSLFESGILDFCEKAILFCLQMIEKYQDETLRLKSIKECKNDQKKVENHVKVFSRQNTIKYILETLCPKVATCWNLISSIMHY